MQQHQIISAVKQTARIPTHEQAEAAVRATLRALGERLHGGETRDLASQLPPNLARELPDEGPGERFGLGEFYERVARYEGAGGDGQQGRRHARAVAAALRGGLAGREFDQLATQLPSEYDDLMGTGPVQHH